MVHELLTKITGTLLEGVCIFKVTSPFIVLWMRNISDKLVKEINPHIISSVFFRKACHL
jgi:hypothetical protein